ncbi:MAG: phosphohydrolase [Synergistaceae bacterium]|nr:phosphohydrolase [Synergistaceae bacterium]
MIASSGLVNIISHTDLDGVVAAALAWYANSPSGPVKISLTGYGEVDNLILEGLRRRDTVIAMDLSPQFQNTIDEIDRCFGGAEPFLFDHHQSAYEKIGGRPWAVVNTKRCGAAVYWDWLANNAPESTKRLVAPLSGFVEVANDRDLWINENPNGRLWQAMVTLCGEWSALARIITNPGVTFTEAERAIVVKFVAAQEERFKAARENISRKKIRGAGGSEMAFLGDGFLEFGDTSDFCGALLDRHEGPGAAPALVALSFRRPSGTWSVSLRSRGGLAGRAVALLKDGRKIRGGGHEDAAALYFPASYDEKSIKDTILSALETNSENQAGMGVTLGDLLKGAGL